MHGPAHHQMCQPQYNTRSRKSKKRPTLYLQYGCTDRPGSQLHGALNCKVLTDTSRPDCCNLGLPIILEETTGPILFCHCVNRFVKPIAFSAKQCAQHH
jgi:hypothetical protein